MVMILLGAAPFASALNRELAKYREPMNTIFSQAMGVSSYDKTKSNGKPTISQPFKEPVKNIKGKDVLIAEDIIHTGHTLADTVLPYVWSFEPKSVAVAALLIKDNSAEVGVPGTIYEGLHIGPKDYVVGEGLDMEGKHRGISGIWRVVFET